MNAPFGRYSLGAGPRLVAAIAWVRIPVAAFFSFPFFFLLCVWIRVIPYPSIGHMRVKAPQPIRTAKLSTLQLNQYYSGGPCGNLEC